MHDVVIIEPAAPLRSALRPRLAALEERVAIVRDTGEARRQLLDAGRARIVIARGCGRAEGVEAMARELPTGGDALAARLVVLQPGEGQMPSWRAACSYLLEVERVLAAVLFPLPEARASERPAGPWKDWPVDFYQPLEQVVAAQGAPGVIARDRITGELRFVLEATRNARVVASLYSRFREALVPWTETLRHEVRGAQRFIASPILLASVAGAPTPLDARAA